MKILFVFFAFVICMFLTPSAVNASYGVSPADITFDYLAPGMKIEKDFLVSHTDTEKETNVVIETDVPGADAWFKFEPGITFKLPKDQQAANLKILLTVPNDAVYKNYKGYINLKFKEVSATPGVSVVGGVGIAVNLTITKSEVSNLLVRKIAIPQVNIGNSVVIVLSAENQGNASVKPDKVLIRLKSGDGTELVTREFDSMEEIPAGGKKDLTLAMENDLKAGEYTAEVAVIFKSKSINNENIVFKVVKTIPSGNGSAVASLSRNNDLIFLTKMTFLSIIPIIFIWVKLRKRVYPD